jgi:diaminohydroxyphosphoribosylaminopyrimidine deaminase/5-amino-6-(5-phosphoribosylamino)uracil reductase
LVQQNLEIDLEMIRRALEVAACGLGQVSPSPLVGCVIVTENGEIVGEGCYIYDKLTHAEVIALNQAGEKSKGATAYVSLEPHAHYGRTPPCTEALINAGIVRVVCPIEDPNPLVAGKGFEFLRQSGIEVVTGILHAEAERQNEKTVCAFENGNFFRWQNRHQNGRFALDYGRRLQTKITRLTGRIRCDFNRCKHGDG